jgi:hypothetical protein
MVVRLIVILRDLASSSSAKSYQVSSYFPINAFDLAFSSS